MKQELNNLVWPALVGVLAAALILDQWVIQRPEGGDQLLRSSYREAVSLATPSVVNIYTAKLVEARRDMRLNAPLLRRLRSNPDGAQRIERSLGSGVILSTEGHVITNNHVIAGADAIQILLADGRSTTASVVGSDPETDLAILKIDLPDLMPIDLAETKDIAVGDVVLAIGNPYGFGHSVSQGIISGVGRFGLQLATYENYIQTDATIHLGSSGGALINIQGQLVGINTLIYTAGGDTAGETPGIGINLATPSDLAASVLEDIVQYGRVIRGWLGVSVDVLFSEGASGVPVQQLIITDLARGGPAERAGILLNDIIVSMDGEPVVDGRAAMLQIARLRPGHLLRVGLERAGSTVELEAVVGTRGRGQ
ncbi:MAG: trypsin-like peptidase domain-containing protein [Luminiphilus sp.]|nr:trypsin-like peptidase domain-containing protein [Luminiphilus sp.]